jgi:AcrR family transcriptional regulator
MINKNGLCQVRSRMSTSTSPSRRRPPAERRAEIRDAARRIALAEGLSAITLRAVAAEVGVAPALVAHYVPAMEDLVAETFGDIVGTELEHLLTAADAGTATARLAALLGEVLRDTHLEVTAVWVDGWALGRRSEALAQRVRDEMDRWEAALTGLVAAGVAEGSFTAADPAEAARAILGMLDGVNAHALVRWGRRTERATLLRTAEGILGARAGSLG